MFVDIKHEVDMKTNIRVMQKNIIQTYCGWSVFWFIIFLLYFQGKLKVKETVTEGFDNMATAFLDLFKGGNTGKAIIKVWHFKTIVYYMIYVFCLFSIE